MKTYTATTLTAEGIIFPEGPRWHGGKLWFSDIHGERVMTVKASLAALTK
jgi:sugar lactone lactonase YvrE